MSRSQARRNRKGGVPCQRSCGPELGVPWSHVPPVLIASLSAGRAAIETRLPGLPQNPALLYYRCSLTKSLAEVKKWAPRPYVPQSSGRRVHSWESRGRVQSCFSADGRWQAAATPYRQLGGAPGYTVRLSQGERFRLRLSLISALPAEILLAIKTKQDPREFELREVRSRWVRLRWPDRGKRMDDRTLC